MPSHSRRSRATRRSRRHYRSARDRWRRLPPVARGNARPLCAPTTVALPQGAKPRKSLQVGSDLWIADYALDCIHVLSRSWQHVDTVRDALVVSPRGLCKNAHMTFVSCFPKASHGYIAAWDTRSFSMFAECDRPRGIACDDDFLFVCEVNLSHVKRIDLRDRTSRVLGQHALLNPRGVALHERGICVADSGNNRVVHMEPDGALLRVVADVCSPNDLVFYQGSLCVSDWIQRCVHVIEGDGTTRSGFARPSSGHLTMMSVFEGALVAGDNEGHAVHLFDASRDLQRVGASRCAAPLQLSSDRIIDLSCQGLDDVDVVRVAQSLMDDRFRAVTNLQLWQNRIGDGGIARIASTLGAGWLPSLRTIWLGHNRVTSAGFGQLARALGRAPRLRDLYADDNQIGSDGVIAFCENAPSQLRRLGLHTKRIGDEGARALLRMVDGLKDLEFVWLHNNSVSDPLKAAIDARAPSSKIRVR